MRQGMKAFLGNSLAALCLLAMPFPAAAQNQNVTSANPVDVTIGNAATDQRLGTTAGVDDAAWYRILTVAGHSYCAETGAAGSHDDKGRLDTVVEVYDSLGTTLLRSNDNIQSEPYGLANSRVCWIEASASAGTQLVKLTSASGNSGHLSFRVYETTQTSAFFYTLGDWNTSVQLKNSTDTGVAYVLAFRDTAGALLGYVNSTLGARASANISARQVTGVGAGKQGSLGLVHNGAAGSLVANATTMSVSAGLSFAGPFSQRPAW